MAPYLAKNDDDFKEAQGKLITHLNLYLEKLQKVGATYKPRFIARSDNDEVQAFKKKYQDLSPIEITDTLFFRLNFPWGLRLGVRVDVHNEYLTITFLADQLSRTSEVKEIRDVCALLRELSGGDLEIDGDLEIAGRQLSEEEAKENSSRVMSARKEKIDLLYLGIWDAIKASLQDDSSMEPRLGGSQLADLRGFAACAPEFADPMGPRHRKVLELRSSRLQDRLEKKIDHDVFQFIKRRPKFFGSLLGFEGLDVRESRSAANVPISGVLDGAAVYGSTLRSTELRDGNQNPLRYFIIYNDNSQNQLARLIRRLNVLAELRIAALMDTKKLRAANRAIRQLAYKLDDPTVASDPIRVSQYNQEYVDADSTKGPPSGAIYRVERSRYYAKSYIERLQDLRIVRIEGWQPYDAFMRRNLFMEFDYISQIGDRFADVSKKLDRLNGWLQINALRTHNKNIADTNAAIQQSSEQIEIFSSSIADHAAALKSHSEATRGSVDALRELAAGIKSAQDRLLELQAVAEPVGIGAFAYYVGSSVSKLVLAVFSILQFIKESSPTATWQDNFLEFICIVLAGWFYCRYLNPKSLDGIWEALQKNWYRRLPPD